jgi:hypothetical protein
MISMLESWMVHGTDHWFMRPTAWRQLPSARRARILHDMANLSRSIGFEYEVSIRDDLRREAIAKLSDENPASNELAAYLAHESAKFNAGDVTPEERDARRMEIITRDMEPEIAKWFRENWRAPDGL